jgi:hypothetical protein
MARLTAQRLVPLELLALLLDAPYEFVVLASSGHVYDDTAMNSM